MVAERAIATTQHLAQNRNIALECHGPALSLDADGQAIQRVLEDLISTALRRNPRDGWVSVDMTALPNGARFTVTDRGEGLPPREVLRTMGPTQSTARALGDGLTVRDGQGEGNGVSFTVLDRSGAAPRVH
jgi:signal transduction histidine kinase